jgi:hypothetical protein
MHIREKPHDAFHTNKDCHYIKEIIFFLNDKTQSGHTIPRTLRKQELHTPGCPLIIQKIHENDSGFTTKRKVLLLLLARFTEMNH